MEPAPFTYVLYHKPIGALTERRCGALGSAEREGLPGGAGALTIYDALPDGYQRRCAALGHVGRLDRDTGGLLLLTDDGQLASALIDPTVGVAAAAKIAKAYAVRVQGLAWTLEDERWLAAAAATGGVIAASAAGELLEDVPAEPPSGCAVSDKGWQWHRRVGGTARRQLEKLAAPIVIGGDGPTAAARVRVLSLAVQEQGQGQVVGEGEGASRISGARAAGEGDVLELEITDGKNRQLRKLCARSGLSVLRLTRTRLGPLALGGLGEGQARELTAEEVAACQASAGAAAAAEVAAEQEEEQEEEAALRHPCRGHVQGELASPVCYGSEPGVREYMGL